MADPQDYAAPGSELQQLLARFAAQPYVPPSSPQGSNSWVGGGINAGIRELRGAGGSAVEALGKLTGLTGLEQWGAEAAENNYRRAAEVGRPDLDIAPWREGGASVLPWLTYQTAKNLPLLGAMFAAPYAIPAAAVPAAAVRAGMSVPSWLGGGAGFARNVAGATLAGYLPAAGGIYREAKEGAEQTGAEITAGTAAAALGAGLPSAVIGGLQPQVLRGILGKDVSGVGGGVLRRLATAGVEGGLAQLPAEGAQAAIEMGFRPDLTLGQKAQRVVDAALTGAALGGVMGAGAGGVREMRGRSPVEVSNEDLSGTVDQQLNLPLGEGTGTAPVRSDVAPPVVDSGVDPRQMSLGLEDVAPRQTSLDLVGGAGVAPAQPDLASIADVGTEIDPRQRELFPVEQSLPLALPDQMAPPAPDLTARPLAREPLARLESVVRVAEYKRAVGAELEPAESAAYQAAVGELQARTQARGLEYLPDTEGVPQRATQRSLRLEGGATYTDPVTAPDPRPQPKVTETQPEMFRRVVGVKLPATVLAAPDLPAALDMIDQAASKRNAPKWALDAAEKAGLDGTLDTRIAEAEAKVAEIRSRWLGEAAVDPAKTLDAVDAQRELTLLQTRKAAIEEMQRRRDESFRETNREHIVGPENHPDAEGRLVSDRPKLPTVTPMSYEQFVQLLRRTPDLDRMREREAEGAKFDAQLEAARKSPNEVIRAAVRALDNAIRTRHPDAMRNALDNLVQLGAMDTSITTLEIEGGAGIQAFDEAKDYRHYLTYVDSLKNWNGVFQKYATSPGYEHRAVSPERWLKGIERELTHSPGVQMSAEVGGGFAVGIGERQALVQVVQAIRQALAANDQTSTPNLPGGPGFLLVKADPNAVPLGDAPFQQALSRAQTRLGSAASALKVVPTVGDLPERVRQAALAQGIPESDIRGTYFDGVGYLVRENVRTEADVQEVALHEIFGHKGARTLLGEGTADKMVGLFDKAGGIAGVMRIARRFNADTALKEYIPDGPLTDADKARVLDEMLAQATGKADGTLKLTALTWAGQIKHQVIKFLEGIGMTALARRMDGFTALDTAVMLRNMRKAVQAGYEVSPDQSVSFSRATDPVTTNDAYNNAAQSVIERASNATSDVLRVAARKTRLYVSSAVDMARTYGPSFQKDANGQTTMDRINVSNDGLGVERKMLNRAFEAPLQEFQKLTKKTQTDIRDLLYTASALDMDPAKSWDEHKHLHAEPQLRAELAKLSKANASLRQRDGGTAGPVLDAIVEQGRTDWYLGQYSRLQGLMKLDPTVDHKSMPSFQSDVLTDFKMEGVTSKSLPEISARAKAALYATLADATAHTKALRTELNTTLSAEQVAAMQAGKPVTYNANQRQQLGQFADLEQMVSNIQASIARIETAPYVHLGRSGDFYVGGKIAGAPDANGKVTRADQRSVKAIQDALTKAGFEDVRMIVGNDNPSMFVRVETQSQATALQQVMQTLQRQGHFQKTEKIFKGSGAEAEVRTGLEQMVPHYIERVVAAIKDRPEFKGGEGATAEETSRLRDAQARMIESVRSASLEMLPAEAFGRLTARRAGVHGVSGDFVRNQAKRARAGANHIANLHYAPEIFDALGQMHEEVRTAEREGTRGINELADMKGAYLEFFRRQATPAPLGGNQWVDIARSATHSYLTAMSPAYAAIQLTQPAVLGLPELGKRFGYMKSAKAMAQSSTVAFNVLREAVKAGWSDNKVRGATDMLITPEVLAKAGVDKGMASFIMRQIMMGSLEFGTQVSELGMLADADVTSTTRKYSQYANTTGFAAEAFTRLLMSVSTYKLAKGNPSLDYIAHDVMQNSMFNYGPANTAQMLNPKSGFLGPATGLASVFMKFQAMLIEKFYGEMGKAFLGQAANATERTQARKFLAGHAAALTVLGGSMALPMVSVLARLTDKMVDMTGEEGDEPYDVKAAWRGWLSDIFGKEMGEVAARGVPRALGIDISARVGEQDILPFSKFLADRRDANEAIEDLALRTEGAGVSTAINIWTGLNDIFNRGDVMGGMIKVLPTALRNPAMALKMSEMGYVDTKNGRLPVTPPTGRSIAAQAMGFAPSEMSEYREARQSQITRKTDLESMAGLIRKHYATAVEQGDQEGAQEALRQMQVFDRKNPAYAVGPGLASVLMQRQLAPIMARQMGVPLGVNRRDVGARGLTEWANY